MPKMKHMKKLNFTFISLLIFLLASCSGLKVKPLNSVDDVERIPASSEESCKDLVTRIVSQNVEPKILDPMAATVSNETAIKALKKNKILTLRDKVYILNHPPVDWFNKLRESLITHMKSWNKNRYPIFYLSKDNNFQETGKKISDLLEKQSRGAISDDETKLLKRIFLEVEKFGNYQSEIKALFEERISLQHNIEVLKKLILEDQSPIDVTLTIKKASGDIKEVVTLRKSDRNRSLVLDKYRKLLKEFNGRIFKPGMIEDRILKQATLKDVMTIYHREVEYAVKNSIHPTPELNNLYKVLSSHLENSDFDPSSYGMFRVDSDVLRAEFMHLTKTDQQVVKSLEFKEKVQKQMRNFFTDRSGAVNPEKVGLFQHMYLSFTNMTVTDITKYGITAVVAVGASQYFLVNPKATTVQGSTGEVTPIGADGVPLAKEGSSVQEIQDPQLENTKKAQEGYIESQYRVIQTKIEELMK